MMSQAKAAAGVASDQIGKSPLGVLYMLVAGASEVTEYAKATGKDGGVPVVHNLIVELGGCQTTWAGIVVYVACVVDEPPEKRMEDLRDESVFLVSWSLIEMFISGLVVDGKEWRADDQTCED
jgi:hypothetical protein